MTDDMVQLLRYQAEPLRIDHVYEKAELIESSKNSN
jgi:hypothetical protein